MVHGTFSPKGGTIHFDPETGKAGGEIVVAATSGESGNNSRDARMHKEILETHKYPDVELTGDRWRGTAKFQVPYVKWGIKDPSNFLLKVKPVINVELEMSGEVKAAK